MKLSVAMCTYNGAVYVREQLASVAAQSRLPDELIVVDDCSNDETPEIIREFAAYAPFRVRLEVNETNLGSTKNFEKAISLCEGEVIALCDQDDVWHPEKLMRIESALSAMPDAGYVFTDAEVVNEDLRPLGFRLWQYVGFERTKQRRIRNGKGLDLLFRGNIVTGATMAFRSRFKSLILPIPEDILMLHDGWIAFVISAAADTSFISEPLIKYRLHSRQQVGIDLSARAVSKSKLPYFQAAMSQRHSYSAQIRALKIACERLSAGGVYRKKAQNQLEALIAHFQARSNMPDAKADRLPQVLRELLTFRYRRYSNGVRSALKDLFC